MDEKYLIGIDNGGTLSKAAVFTADGRELAVAGRPVQILSPHPGWSERDMHAMWLGTAEAIREALEKSGIDPAAVAGVACTGHGNGLYLIDKHGAPVRNGINSSDSRGAATIADRKSRGVNIAAWPPAVWTNRAWSWWPAPGATTNTLRGNR